MNTLEITDTTKVDEVVKRKVGRPRKEKLEQPEQQEQPKQERRGRPKKEKPMKEPKPRGRPKIYEDGTIGKPLDPDYFKKYYKTVTKAKRDLKRLVPLPTPETTSKDGSD